MPVTTTAEDAPPTRPVPLITVKVTGTPPTPFCPSETHTLRGAGRTVLCSALWLLPMPIAMLDA